MGELANQLKKEGWLKTPQIIEAFKQVSRADFVASGMKAFAFVNKALPIGWGQTISQPSVVAFMLELLEPKEGEKILDIGAGSGWTTVLLGKIVGPTGKVIGIEVNYDVAKFGRSNIEKYNLPNVEYICQNGYLGYKEEAPFDKILISAALAEKELPPALKKQLKVGGIIVTPIKSSIFKFEKTSGKFKEEEFKGFVFVPFIKT